MSVGPAACPAIICRGLNSEPPYIFREACVGPSSLLLHLSKKRARRQRRRASLSSLQHAIDLPSGEPRGGELEALSTPDRFGLVMAGVHVAYSTLHVLPYVGDVKRHIGVVGPDRLAMSRR